MPPLHRPAEARASKHLLLVHVEADLLHQEVDHVGVALHAAQVVGVAAVAVELPSVGADTRSLFVKLLYI